MKEQSTPFAQALLSIALEQSRPEFFLHHLENMKKTLIENPELEQVLSHPGVEDAIKQNLLQTVFADELKDEVLANFLQVLVLRKQAGALPRIADAYRELLHQEQNIQTVTVQSAVMPSHEQQKKLKETLEKKLQAKVELKIEVDPSLIAGMKILADGMMMDATYAGRLETMKEQLKKS
jgi:F-type H+-transporting ATPase subunit delta